MIHLSKAIDQETSSDIKLTVEGKAIFAHKIFLKIRCPKLFEFIKESQTHYEISDFTHDQVLVFLKYCYSGIVPSILDSSFLKLVSLYCDTETVDLFEKLMACTKEITLGRMKILGKISRKLRNDMKMMKEDKSLVDIKFVVEGKVILVHKIVLFVRSEYFEKLMTSGMKESRQAEVKLQDAPLSAMEKYFEYVYFGHVTELSGDDAVSLLCHCHFFMDERLLCICQSLVIEALEVDNVVDLYLVAKDVSLSKLLNSCKDYLYLHFEELLRHSSLKNLPFEDLEKLYLAKDPTNAAIFAKQKKIWELNQPSFNSKDKLKINLDSQEIDEGKREVEHKTKPKKSNHKKRH